MRKIYYTVGPASVDIVDKMVEAGVDGVRLTFSYGTPDIQLTRAKMVQSAAQAKGLEPFIIADLEGGGARIGTFSSVENIQSFPVSKGELVELVQTDEVNIDFKKKIPVPNKFKIGDILVIGDNSAYFEVVKQDGRLFGRSLINGVVESRRSLFVQNSEFNPVCLTEKDIQDLRHIARHSEYNAVALSFVNRAEDVIRAKEIITAEAGEVHKVIIAKIETEEGVNAIEEICDVADQIMVARGDLALALPWQYMPKAVERIVSVCQSKNTPFIMATQVADGMLHGNSLTRAEMTDLWHWCQENVDGVLLSRETAWGNQPIETVINVRTLLDVK